MVVARSVPDKDEHQSLFVSWALLQQNVSQFQVGQCLQFWTSEAFTSEIILPCCLLIYFKLVYHELTSLHIHYECVWITPVASWNYTSILPKILVYKFGWCHDCRIIPQWPNQDRHFGQVRKAQSLSRDNCADQRRHWLQWRSIPQACLPWAPLTVLVPSFWTYQVTYFRTVKTLGVSLPGSGSDTFFRHFMELVCAGLSKNPYMSSAKKVSTITWFQEYFEREENKEILVHAGYWQEKQARSAS